MYWLIIEQAIIKANKQKSQNTGAKYLNEKENNTSSKHEKFQKIFNWPIKTFYTKINLVAKLFVIRHNTK